MRREIFRALVDKPMSISKMSRKLKIRREFLGGYLKCLEDEGQVELIKVGRSMVYRLKGR